MLTLRNGDGQEGKDGRDGSKGLIHQEVDSRWLSFSSKHILEASAYMNVDEVALEV